jgi:hypothetical protein
MVALTRFVVLIASLLSLFIIGPGKARGKILRKLREREVVFVCGGDDGIGENQPARTTRVR